MEAASEGISLPNTLRAPDSSQIQVIRQATDFKAAEVNLFSHTSLRSDIYSTIWAENIFEYKA